MLASQNAIRVLIIDDDRKLCGLVRDYLEPLGYRVTAAHSGTDGLERLFAGDFQAVILDVMLPGMDGFDVLKTLRRRSDVPVLMLTSRGDETDRIVGLELGADDYLPKTFSTRELLARLRAVTRRAARAEAGDGGSEIGTRDTHLGVGDESPVEVAGLRIDPGTREAFLDGSPVELTPMEFDLLLVLARSGGKVMTRDRLLLRLAGRDHEVFDRSIDVHVSSLRRKLGDDPRAPRFIRTVRTVGYLFVASDPVTP